MTLIQEIEGTVLEGLATFVTTNAPAIEAYVGTGENAAVAEVAALLKSLPNVSGPYGMIVGPLEGVLETWINAQAAALVAKFGPTVLVTLLSAYLTGLAKKVQGAS